MASCDVAHLLLQLLQVQCSWAGGHCSVISRSDFQGPGEAFAGLLQEGISTAVKKHPCPFSLSNPHATLLLDFIITDLALLVFYFDPFISPFTPS